MMKFFDFCSGIGGGRLALEAVGCECVGFAEKDKTAAMIYSYLMGDDKNAGDILQIDIDSLPNFDIMLASFPYKNFAARSKKTGFTDNKAHEITALINILSVKKTSCFIFENDKGFVFHNKGKSFKTVVTALKSLGYEVFHKILNAENYGIPHIRERLYIVGILKTRMKAPFSWTEELISVPLSEFLRSKIPPIFDLDNSSIIESLLNEHNRGRVFIEKILEKDYTVIDRSFPDIRVYDGKIPALRNSSTKILYVKDKRLRIITAYESLALQGFPTKYTKKIKEAGVDEKTIRKYAVSSVSVNVLRYIADELIKCVGSCNTKKISENIPSGIFEKYVSRKDIRAKFNDLNSAECTKWLEIMGYKDVEKVTSEISKEKLSAIKLEILLSGKRKLRSELLSVYVFSEKSKTAEIGRFQLQNLRDFWNIPTEIDEILTEYTKNSLKFTEITIAEKEIIRRWFYQNRFLIVSDILTNRKFAASWVIICHKKENIKWEFMGMGTLTTKLSSGDVYFSSNSLKICGIVLSKTRDGRVKFSFSI